MTRSLTSRLGLQRWSAVGDTQQRSDFDNDNAQLEALAAIARQDTFANRGSATTWSRSFFHATDTGERFYSDGVAWFPIGNLGAWKSYTPTYSAGNGDGSLGNGTVSGRYVQNGKTVNLVVQLTAGSTTVMGTGNFRLSLPPGVARYTGSPTTTTGSAHAQDASAGASYPLWVGIGSGATAMTFLSHTVGATYVGLGGTSGTAPFVWAVSDTLFATITFEAA